jgi:hypothetical protein
MNFKIIKPAALAVLAIGVWHSAICDASAQVSPLNNLVLTNVPPTVAAGTAVTSNNVVNLTRYCGLSVGGRFNGSAASGTELVYGSFSNDNTNFGMAPFILTGSTVGTTPPTNGVVQTWTNWSQAQLSGFTAVQFSIWTNSGSGTITNWAWLANRPTFSTQTY